MGLIVAPVILFCAFVSQGLVNEFPHQLGHLIVVLSAVFTTCVRFPFLMFLVYSILTNWLADY